MKIEKTPIQGLLVLEPRVFDDERGWFMESFNQKVFDEAVGAHTSFVQDNHSYSKKGTLRGLHLQADPFQQGKLVRAVEGTIWDVAVDVRKGSDTYGSWHAETLSAENRKQLWIPPGFAHGFLVLSDTAQLLYKTNQYYNYSSERCIYWNDEYLNIKWPKLEAQLVISNKDKKGISFSDL